MSHRVGRDVLMSVISARSSAGSVPSGRDRTGHPGLSHIPFSSTAPTVPNQELSQPEPHCCLLLKLQQFWRLGGSWKCSCGSCWCPSAGDTGAAEPRGLLPVWGVREGGWGRNVQSTPGLFPLPFAEVSGELLCFPWAFSISPRNLSPSLAAGSFSLPVLPQLFKSHNPTESGCCRGEASLPQL